MWDSELLFVDFHSSSRKTLTLGVFYRPPNSNLKPLEDLQSALNNLSTPELVLMGDFNLSEFDWTNNTPLTGSEPHMLLTDIIQDNFLTQLVDQPTREGNILDLVLTSNKDLKPGFHIIVGIAGIARIAEKLVQRSWRSQRSQRSTGFHMIAVIAENQKKGESYRIYLLRLSSNSSWYTYSCNLC